MKIRSHSQGSSRIVRSIFAAFGISLGYVTHKNDKYDEEFLAYEAGSGPNLEQTLRDNGLRVWGSREDLQVEERK